MEIDIFDNGSKISIEVIDISIVETEVSIIVINILRKQ